MEGLHLSVDSQGAQKSSILWKQTTTNETFYLSTNECTYNFT